MICLLGGIALLHPWFWSQFPPDADPINFVSALRDYDITADSPHPPGYPLYVGAARAFAAFVGEAHAYQALNLCLLLGMCAALYTAMCGLGMPAVGLAAAALAGLHPLAWSATVIQESYITDGFFSCLVFLIAAWAGARPGLHASLIAAAFLLIGMVRPVSATFLLPLAWLTPLILREGAPSRTALTWSLLTAVLAVGSTGVAWLFTVWLAGGIDVYRANVSRVMGVAASQLSMLAGAPARAHLAMLARLYVWFAVLALPAAAGVALAYWTGTAKGRWRLLAVCAAWIAPALAFYSLVYYLKPTYQLVYLPALCLLAAWGILRAAGARRWVPAVCLGLLAGAGLVFFLTGPASLPLPLRRLTAGYVAERDAAWSRLYAGLDGIPREGSLLVWDAPPRLHLHSVKLLPWSATMATPRPGRDALELFVNRPMKWLDGPPIFGVPPEYARIVHVFDAGGEVAVEVIDLGESRRVSELFQPPR